MPFLDASALEADPDGAAFLLAVLRWRPQPKAGAVGARFGLLLGPHAIRLDRGLTANRRALTRARGGYRVSRPALFQLPRPSDYRVTIRTGALA